MTSNRIKYYFNVAICLALTFGFGYLPPIGGMTALGMKAIGIFFGVLWGWIFIDLGWPSLLGIFAVGMTGYMTVAQSFATAFSDSQTLQMILVLALVAYLEESGCSTYLARWFVSRKIGVGRPWIFSLLILSCGFVASMFTFGTAAIILTWAIFTEICHTLQMTKEDAWTRIILFGVVVAALSGAICLPYQVMSVVFIGGVESSAGITVDTAAFSLFRILTGYGLVVLYMLAARFIFNPDVSKLMTGKDLFEEMRNQKMNHSEKTGLIVFILFLAMMILPNNFPASWPLIAPLKSLGLVGIVLLLVIILSILHVTQNGEDKSIVDFTTLMRKINWTIVMLLGGVAPMSALLESEEAGIFTMVTNMITPMAESMGSLMFMLVLSLVLGILTQLTHNLVLARIAIPLVVPIGIAIGIDPMLMMMSVCLPTQFAVLTPGASANAALVWGNTTWTNTKSVAKLAFLAFVLMMLYNTIVILPLAQIIF